MKNENNNNHCMNKINKKETPEKIKPTNNTKKTAKKGAFRVWQDRDGNKLRARFVRMDGTRIILEYNEKGVGLIEKGFAIRNFCEKDQEFIRENYE